MRFDIMTLFPEMIENGLHTSIIGRAIQKGLLSLRVVNIRDFTTDKHGKVDDYTYGGGAGMLLQAQPIYDAYRSLADREEEKPRLIYVTPQGKLFDQQMAKELAKEEHLIFLCGHYEGVDERVLEEIVTDHVSIGDFVLTGGELPAMVMVDAISRNIPGVLHNEESADTESFGNGLLEYPQYTRPEVWHDKAVPAVLISGDHAKVDAWRLEQSILRTKERRPELYEQYMAEHPETDQTAKKRRKKKMRSKNPITTAMYTADPAPMVSGDTLYLYTTHDEDQLVNDFYTMFDWRCFSTKDMVHWTDHGAVFSLDDISWADDRAWAPQAVERNGKYYLYCPVHKKDSGMAIAVGVSDSPVGPFKDLGYPLVDEGDWNDIDPTVFIDDDGQAYLYFGNPELRYVLLNEDMVSYDEAVGVVKIPMTEEAFAKGGHMTGTSYGEGPWFYKRNNIYYMVYAAFGEGEHRNEHLAYSTSASPTGPWVYGGVLMEESEIFTNHPGIADFKGHSYLFYHTGELPGGSLFHRSVCVAEFHYNEDGSIDTIEMCDGVDAV